MSPEMVVVQAIARLKKDLSKGSIDYAINALSMCVNFKCEIEARNAIVSNCEITRLRNENYQQWKKIEKLNGEIRKLKKQIKNPA